MRGFVIFYFFSFIASIHYFLKILFYTVSTSPLYTLVYSCVVMGFLCPGLCENMKYSVFTKNSKDIFIQNSFCTDVFNTVLQLITSIRYRIHVFQSYIVM